MIITVASGKGGTGKTTVATSLATVAPPGAHLLDCDVEQPNAHLFLQPTFDTTETITLPVPHVDLDACDACGKCGQICQFSAIVALKTKPLTFPELCHGCGGCSLVCPTNAITEVSRDVGTLEKGDAHHIRFVHGRLRIGEAMAPPLIRAVKSHAAPNDTLTIIDAPPGTSCPVIEAIRHSDYVVLVTEPTPFGLHDLKLAVDMARELDLPFGVVINRADIGDNRVVDYCQTQNIDILLQIPHDRRIAEAYSKGQPPARLSPTYANMFTQLLNRIQHLTSPTTEAVS